MTVSPPIPNRWSHHRWRRTILGIFLFQLAFLWFFSDRLPEPRKAPSHLGKLSLIHDAKFEAPLDEILRLMDPTLFAFASAHGFSGEAWFNAKLPAHRLEDKIILPRWLEADSSFLGRTELSVLRSGLLSSMQSSEKSELRLWEVGMAQPPICPQSFLEVEAPLNQRFIPTNEILRPWGNKEILSHTTVQIVVDASGDVLATRLGSGCGLKEANDFALDHAKGLRFQPADAGGQGASARMPLAWGKLVYHWATTNSATSTNPKANP